MQAIKILHENGIAHRDIKPENIMLNHNGDPILIDFGLANVKSIGAGTPAYSAPE